VVVTTSLVVALFWSALFVADYLLELQIAPLDLDGDGIWSPAEEATWTAEDRRRLAAHFGDGGRNVFALLVPPVVAIYASGLWLAAHGLLRAGLLPPPPEGAA
jgi:hypothetical protein